MPSSGRGTLRSVGGDDPLAQRLAGGASQSIYRPRNSAIADAPLGKKILEVTIPGPNSSSVFPVLVADQ